LKHTIGTENALTRAVEHHHYHEPYSDWADYITKVHPHMSFGDRLALLGDADVMDDEAEFFRGCSSVEDSHETIPFLSGMEFRNYLQNDILTKVDRMSMQHSLEVRVPLLDHRIVEFAASLPSSLKSQGGVQKIILRQLCERLYPDPAVHRSFARPKHGFGFPWVKYVEGPLRQYIEDGFRSSQFQSDLGLEPRAIDRVLGSFSKGRGFRDVWLIFCLFVWWDRNLRQGSVV